MRQAGEMAHPCCAPSVTESIEARVVAHILHGALHLPLVLGATSVSSARAGPWLGASTSINPRRSPPEVELGLLTDGVAVSIDVVAWIWGTRSDSEPPESRSQLQE